MHGVTEGGIAQVPGLALVSVILLPGCEGLRAWAGMLVGRPHAAQQLCKAKEEKVIRHFIMADLRQEPRVLPSKDGALSLSSSHVNVWLAPSHGWGSLVAPEQLFPRKREIHLGKSLRNSAGPCLHSPR